MPHIGFGDANFFLNKSLICIRFEEKSLLLISLKYIGYIYIARARITKR